MSDLAHWVALWRVPGIGPALFLALLERFGSPAEVLHASHAQLEAARLSPQLIRYILGVDLDMAEPDLRWHALAHHHIITLSDSRYPARLREIATAPPLLYVAGKVEQLNDPQLAMVGSRHPTVGGLENARAFANHLAASGLTITSGLALGIDAASHEAALDAGGVTIAVAATGLDRVYPARHRELAHRIASQGAIVSEFPIGTAPKAQLFPRRNRIISGLSLGTLVVEAARRSGSLITARHAMEQGREVFAMPASIHNPLAKGCHQLIRQGAKLVECVDDILVELADQIDLNETPLPETSKPAAAGFVPDDDYRRVLEALGHDPTPIDVIVERSGLTPAAVSSMLLILELNGHVAPTVHGAYVRLTAEP